MIPICSSRRIHIDGFVSCECHAIKAPHKFEISRCIGCYYSNKCPEHDDEEPGLGDNVEKLLTSVGITKKRVEYWIGAPCNCDERRRKLNKFGKWVKKWSKKAMGNQAKQELETLIDQNCVYLKKLQTPKKTKDGRDVFGCLIHEHCTKEGESSPFASCEKCKQKLTTDDKKLSKNFVDHLKIYDREFKQTHALRNILAGRPAFLVCGGPSAKQLDLTAIEQRGCFSLAVNNMAAYYKASAFVCSDPPSKFHEAIWTDPQTFKFIPSPKMRPRRGKIRRKIGGKFEEIGKSACHCPNVWGFERRSWWKCDDTFFTEDSASWGNHDAGVVRTGEKKTVMTMLLAMRLLYYLGSRRIYLVGVDFKMDADVGLTDNYAFGEARDQNAIGSNNNQYNVVNEWLIRMQGTFAKFGLEIYNTNPNSHLRAFAHVPYTTAVDDVLKDYPKTIDLVDWYKK